MGTVISKAANGVGSLLGNAFAAPFKAVFALVFFYLMFKVGICQCIGKSLCKMCCAACETYWFALEDITCFLLHKLKNIKRINRRRRHRRFFRDVEVGCSSDEESTSCDVDESVNRRKIRKRKDRLRRSSYTLRQGSKSRDVIHSYHHHRLRLKSRDVSVHVKGRSEGAKYSRQLQMRKLSSLQREATLFKKRRFR
ncbi:uncharacterized protein LOC130788274 [Actinidia eriantha]|uniref:uncharacterized protein LOC130788274 n=1 Tax=Actinidia eriantha TaxID=165200 RepID=UPI0025874712|nr:uncharacterized protein LOC130788274 [Actinidia eriantha]